MTASFFVFPFLHPELFASAFLVEKKNNESGIGGPYTILLHSQVFLKNQVLSFKKLEVFFFFFFTKSFVEIES